MDAARALFQQRAARADAADWSILFWRSLLEQPALRAPLAKNRKQPLSLLDAGPRATLLLRYVGKLDEGEAALALNVSQAAYRHALQRATAAMRDAGFDEAWLQGLAEAWTEAPAAPRPASSSPMLAATTDAPSREVPPWLHPALIVALGLLASVGIGSYFWHPAFLHHAAPGPGVVEELPGHAPAATLPATANLLASGDFAQLADPQGAELARNLDLYSWYAANAVAPATGKDAATSLPEAAQPETSAPDVDAASSETEHAP